jgi:lipid-A-disaccharide synthase
MLGAARRLAERLPVTVCLIKAPAVPAELFAGPLGAAGVAVEVIESDRFPAIARAHLALCASGTATLEVGLIGTPLIVLYRLASWTWALAKLLVKVPHASLVNLVLERGAVPEMLQSRAEPEAVAAAAAALLGDPERIAAMRRDLAELRGRLGEGGASARAAARVAARLAAPATAAPAAATPSPTRGGGR